MLTDLPLLICVNLQNEFLREYGSNWIVDGSRILDLCLVLQLQWRRNMWPIAHLKRIANPAYFTPAPDLADWIDQAKPMPTELVFEHSLPSAYSSARFREYMAHIGPIRCVVVGFSLHDSIVSTIIDGYHRGDRFEIVSDAVGCTRTQNGSLKSPILDVLKSFSRIVDAAAVGEPS